MTVHTELKFSYKEVLPCVDVIKIKINYVLFIIQDLNFSIPCGIDEPSSLIVKCVTEIIASALVFLFRWNLFAEELSSI